MIRSMKDKQKQLLTEIMNEDAKDGLYKQQTAVEWYINEMNKALRESGINVQLPKEGKEYEQAKAMEKEQIMYAYNMAAYQLPLDIELDLTAAEKYYNNRYESNT